MKLRLLIVDDEYWIREGLKAKIDWERTGALLVGEASSGDEALEAIERERPDAVLLDIRLPPPDGLEVARRAREGQPGLRIAIITGHAEFEYARRALEYGVRDFLLKPVDEAELNETVVALRREIEEERILALAPWKDRGQDSAQAMRDGASLWEGLFPPRGAGASEAAYLGCLLELEAEGAGAWEALSHELLPKIGADFRLLRNRRPGEPSLLLLRAEASGIEDLRSGLDRLPGLLAARKGAVLTIGVGSPEASWELFPASLRAAGRAMRERLLGGKGRAYFPAAETSPALAYLNRITERKLLQLLEEGDRQGAARLLGSVFDRMEADAAKLGYGTIEAVCLKLFELASSWGAPESAATSDGCDARAQLHDLAELLEKAEGIPSLRAWFLRDLETRFGSGAEELKGGELMAAARDYVEANCSAPLSLASVAHRFGLHPNYFSQRFKECSGQGLVEFIRETRLGRARALLAGTDERIDDIALAVGYEDPKYFSDLFKERYGMTPTQFRQRERREADDAES